MEFKKAFVLIDHLGLGRGREVLGVFASEELAEIRLEALNVSQNNLIRKYYEIKEYDFIEDAESAFFNLVLFDVAV